MYYIYIDEAGTSEKEEVTVVVGVIVHADTHWIAASNRLQFLINEYVPPTLREGFHFHAKDIWAGYREFDTVWPRHRRAQFIGAVAAIPRRLGMAISLGKVRRDFVFKTDPNQFLHDIHHYLAFNRCIARANKYVRDWAAPNEVATAIAEEVPKKITRLKHISRLNIDHLIDIDRDFLHGPDIDFTPSLAGPVDKIIDTVHFVKKNEAPLLQISDACAFSFRRYFCEQEYGEFIMANMMGSSLSWPEWQGPVSEILFSFNPSHQYPTV